MIQPVSALRRLLGRSPAEQAAQPVLAGYRRTAPRGLRILLLVLLAAACLAYGVTFGLLAPAKMTPFAIPDVVILGLLLWSLPPGDYAPTNLIEPLFLGFFAALLLWPNYLAVALFNLPWMTLLRLTGVPLALVLLACISISGPFRKHLSEIVGADKLMLRFVVILAGLWTFSIALSRDPTGSINHYALALVNLIGIFFAASFLFSRPGFADYWARALMVMLAILCVFAVWELKLRALPWAGHIPGFLKIDDPVVQKILAGSIGGVDIYRIKATATTPLGLAELLGLATPFAMHFALGSYPLYLRVANALFIPFSIFVILMTDSRLGVVAAFASVLFYLLIWALLRWRQVKGSLFAPALALSYPLIFVAFMSATFTVDALRTRFWGRGDKAASTQGRLDQWHAGIPKIITHPLGQGIGEGANVLGFTNLGGTLTIDSYWLSVLLEIGFAGFIVFYGLMLRGAYVAARTVVTVGNKGEFSLLLPMSVSLLNFVIVKMVFSQDANHPLIFMILGAVVGLTYRSRLLPAQAPAAQVTAGSRIGTPTGAMRPSYARTR